jgi:hypothetical protein
LFTAASARAQDQEKKLVDRLLRPDTELQNSAQKKQFGADRTAINKKANVRAFYVRKTADPRKYTGQRDFSPWQFNARSWPRSRQQANSFSRNEIVDSRRHYSMRNTVTLRSPTDAEKIASSQDYSGQRKFLGKGKSQKAISQHDTPMTIEQVRELLNKNK